MKKYFTIVLIILLNLNVFSQAPPWVWARSAGGGNDQVSEGIAIDGNGNSYITGLFSGNAISFGSITLNNFSSNFTDIFIAKYDASGNVIWAKSAQGGSVEDGLGIAVDTNGNSYITGYFYSPYLNIGSITLTNTNNTGNSTDLFIIKVDSSGNPLWGRSAGGINSDNGWNIAVDGIGNVYITGTFASSTINFGSTTLNKVGGTDMFIAKYDLNGNLVWVKSAGGSNDEVGYGIGLDNNGNSIVTGSFKSPSITFGSITLTNIDTTGNSSDIFIVKYDANGNVVWAKSDGGILTEISYSIAIDGSGNIYISGFFGSSSVTFGGNTITNTGTGADIFIAKYNANGNPIWAKSGGGTGSDISYKVAVDMIGNSYIIGIFTSPVIILSNHILFNTVTSSLYKDIFIAEYDVNGSFIWGKSIGGSDSDSGRSLGLDGNGNCYVTGYFKSLSMTCGTTTLTNSGLSLDLFIGKLNSTVGIIENELESNVNVYPNPATDKLNININTINFISSEITITNIQGEKVKTFIQTKPENTIDISSLKSGMYFLEMNVDGKRSVMKIAKE